MKATIRLAVSLVAVLMFAARGAGGALARTTLKLKDEGVPIAVGGELGVELEMSFGSCKLAQRAHVSVIGAKKDRLTVERPAMKVTGCPPPEGAFAGMSLEGGVKEIALSDARSATINGAPIRIWYRNEFGPAKFCEYEFKRFRGAFPAPGRAAIRGSAMGRLKGASFSQPPAAQCEQSASSSFVITVTGRNGKPLETELGG